MNEITTEERLRIVEELNRTANDSLGGESLQRALARITGAEDTSWRGVMRRVAELAYRPTTQVQVAPDGRYHCFACGHDGRTEPTGGLNYYLKEHRVCRGYDDTAMERATQDMIERAYTVGRMESSKAVARETARIIAGGIAKELGMTPGEE